jgi:outer membrane protein with beta-barrel domain
MRQTLRVAVLLCASLFIAAGTSLAQGTRGEWSGGWRHLYVAGSDGEDGVNFPRGWYVDVALHLNEMFSVVGDVGGNYKSEDITEVFQGITVTGNADASVHTFMGGLRVRSSGNPAVVPYGQILFGGAHAGFDVEASSVVNGQTITVSDDDSETEAAMSIGGGVNLGTPYVAIRLHAEWLKILQEDSGNAFRFAVGVVVPF